MNNKITDQPPPLTVTPTGKPTMIPPARPTPNGNHYLSNLDYCDMIIYVLFPYKSTHKVNENAAQVLRTSLSEVLVHYYPLAGRLKFDGDGRPSVECTGDGAVFVEADADRELGDVDFSKPDYGTRSKLVLKIDGAKSALEIPPLMVQVTRFKCGAFVLGVSYNHFLGDGVAIIEFLNSWAETARGLPLSVPPFIDTTLLKARTPLSIDYHHSEYDDLEDKSPNSHDEEPVVYEYAHFTSEMISKIKQRVLIDGKVNGQIVTRCSTFEAVVAFVWRARIEALKMSPEQETRLMLVMDVRDRVIPKLPKGYFGNAVKMMTTGTWLACDIMDKPLCYAVKKIQDAIEECGDGIVRSTIDYIEATRATRPLGYTMIATAWYRLPTNSIDFGWGEPLAFEPVESPQYESITFLAHDKEITSINAFIGLPVSAMKTFQKIVRRSNRVDYRFDESVSYGLSKL